MRIVKDDLLESVDIIQVIMSNNAVSHTVIALLTAKDYALVLLTSIPAEKALSLGGKSGKVIDNKTFISAAEKISTARPSQSAIWRRTSLTQSSKPQKIYDVRGNEHTNVLANIMKHAVAIAGDRRRAGGKSYHGGDVTKSSDRLLAW